MEASSVTHRHETHGQYPPIGNTSSITLLGQIVEKVSGQSLREFTTARIFAPLGMNNTHFRDDFAEIVKNQAIGYEWDADRGAFRVSVTNFDTVGPTSLLTTVEDLARWDKNFYEPKVGGKEFVDQMLENGKLNNGQRLNYLFGLTTGYYRGLKTVSHGGADAGYRSQLLRFPDHQFSVICVFNLAENSAFRVCHAITDIYLASHFKTSSDPVPQADESAFSKQDLSRYEGLYWCDEKQSAVRTTAGEGKLLARSGDWNWQLRPIGPGLFSPNDWRSKIRFEPSDGSGPVTRFIEGEEAWQHVYQRVEPFRPTAQQLKVFTGVYRSEEIDSVYRMALDQGELVLHRWRFEPDRLEPIFHDTFQGKLGWGGVLRFDRDAEEGVTGFSLNTPGVKNLSFVKERS